MIDVDVNSLILAIVAASPAYMKILFDIKKSHSKFEKAFRSLVEAQSKRDLTNAMYVALERDWTFREEIDSVDTLYEPYHNLGWNGKLDDLHDKFKRLKIKEI